MKFQFRPDGLPTPTFLVSQNGGGKTTLLSIIGGALIHAASTAFGDVVTPFGGTGKSYFRMVGGRLVTYGQSGAFSVLKFKDHTEEWFYTENSGDLAPEDARSCISETLAPGIPGNKTF